MSDEHQGASGEPRAAIWRGLEDIRLWLQKQADECRQSAEQIEGRVRAGRPFNGDENVAAHNRTNQAFFQTKADTISEAQAALRACADALAPAPDAELREQVEFQRARADKWVAIAERYGSEIEALKARADALAPPEPKYATDEQVKASAARMIERHRPSLEKLAAPPRADALDAPRTDTPERP